MGYRGCRIVLALIHTSKRVMIELEMKGQLQKELDPIIQLEHSGQLQPSIEMSAVKYHPTAASLPRHTCAAKLSSPPPPLP